MHAKTASYCSTPFRLVYTHALNQLNRAPLICQFKALKSSPKGALFYTPFSIISSRALHLINFALLRPPPTDIR